MFINYLNFASIKFCLIELFKARSLTKLSNIAIKIIPMKLNFAIPLMANLLNLNSTYYYIIRNSQ